MKFMILIFILIKIVSSNHVWKTDIFWCYERNDDVDVHVNHEYIHGHLRTAIYPYKFVFPFNISEINADSNLCNLRISVERKFHFNKITNKACFKFKDGALAHAGHTHYSKSYIHIHDDLLKVHPQIDENDYIYIDVFIHEFGHIIGLSHNSYDPTDVMYSFKRKESYLFELYKNVVLFDKILSRKNLLELISLYSNKFEKVNDEWAINKLNGQWIYFGTKETKCVMYLPSLQNWIVLC
ncbi:ORF MSV176 putative metalloprotease, similar to Homo sapiens GB:X89576 [Melanoplus sanguinipes entomopoxvirus]|uniref:ORF MSV176 putative metalloprotease, similar to Homo sapiens GB:X89576 n=1 Tax=Melanoplus sanguinipes entomopoxvirus TaxID=83191 RepID=Q9YVR6_MSEPV|nr:ORF MSV176 putative metalloprotease, similar to Homo sapiens GB:X89576 [Melanoplus sanguinipes entomopoxvirus]AAC97773.1 ORF MSV176 putative metalloprotease, similar to Homo sapiens GB:X89576 [Melanoplus sanguinipes entomopoxvirus 'O']